MLLGDTQSDQGPLLMVHICKNQQMVVTATALPGVNAFKIGTASQVLRRTKTQVGQACGGVGGLSDVGLSVVWLG